MEEGAEEEERQKKGKEKKQDAKGGLRKGRGRR